MCVGLAGWTDAGVVVSACVRWSAWLLSLCGLASRGAWVVGWRAGVCVVVWGPWGSPAFQSSATSSRRAVGRRWRWVSVVVWQSLFLAGFGAMLGVRIFVWISEVLLLELCFQNLSLVV